ncbi:MAG TPA: MFS transporter, partial [Sediminispirochaeta sp.]|nr:MFS transporter [Sediminispirochaeta sp.]
PLYSLSIALINDQLNPNEMVHAAGALVVLYGIGSSIGPYSAGWIMSWIGPKGLFLFIATVLALFAIISISRIILIPMIPQKYHESYHPYPRTTFAAFKLVRKRRSRKKEAKV